MQPRLRPRRFSWQRYNVIMSTMVLVSVEEYLETSYRPDCDYVNGVIEERNVGQREHSGVQESVLAWYRSRRKELRLRAFPEQRIRVAPGRYRVPDVSVVPLPSPTERIFTTPPLIVIEILSPDDSFPKLQERLDDYLAMGIPNVWVIDPNSRRGWHITRAGHLEALDGVLRSTDGKVATPLTEVFALDED